MRTIFLLTLLGLFVSSVQATTVLYQNLYQLIDSSDHVVAGVVTDISSRREVDGNIYTVVTLENAQVITATGPNNVGYPVKLRYLGGTIEQYGKNQKTIEQETLLVHGSPEFEVTEEVIVFVRQNGIAEIPFSGFNQGVFKVNSRDEVLDGEMFPVVGINGADLIFQTKKGLELQGSRLVIPSEEEKINSKGVFLIESEGGLDTLIQPSISNRSESGLSKHSFYAVPISVKQFRAKIQEYLASSERPKTATFRDLRVLPPIEQRLRYATDIHGNPGSFIKDLNTGLVSPTSIGQQPQEKIQVESDRRIEQ